MGSAQIGLTAGFAVSADLPQDQGRLHRVHRHRPDQGADSAENCMYHVLRVLQQSI